MPSHDLRDALGRRPTHLADADGMSDDDLRLPGFVLGEVKQPHRCDVDHEPFMWRVRKDELRRQHNLPPRSGQPGVDPGVGTHDLLITDVEAACDVSERVFLRGRRDLHLADDVLARRELEAFRLRGRRDHGSRRRRRRRRRLMGRGSEESAAAQSERPSNRHQGGTYFGSFKHHRRPRIYDLVSVARRSAAQAAKRVAPLGPQRLLPIKAARADWEARPHRGVPPGNAGQAPAQQNARLLLNPP